MFEIEQIRRRHEQRLARSLESWNEAKKQLEIAIGLAEARERELREVSADVRRRLDALDFVNGMANEPESGGDVPPMPAPNPPETQGAGADLHRLGGFLNRRSRPLFSSEQRAGFSALSIPQQPR
jgi:hypothetical protein